MAESQLGTVGSGNHCVDLMEDELVAAHDPAGAVYRREQGLLRLIGLHA